METDNHKLRGICQAANNGLSGRTTLAFIGGSAILNGLRGKPPGDMDALVQATVNFSLLIAETRNNFEGIEINPLVVLPMVWGLRP